MGAQVDPAQADEHSEERASGDHGDPAGPGGDHDRERDREREPADRVGSVSRGKARPAVCTSGSGGRGRSTTDLTIHTLIHASAAPTTSAAARARSRCLIRTAAPRTTAEPTIAIRPSLVTTRAAPSSHGTRRSSAISKACESRASEELPVTAIVRTTNAAMAARATTTSSHGMDARRMGIASRITPVLRTTRSVRDKRHRGVDSAPIGGSSRPGRPSRGRSPEQSPYGRPLRKRAAPRGPHGSRVVNSLSGLAAGSTWDDGICRGLLLGGVRAHGLAAAGGALATLTRRAANHRSRYVAWVFPSAGMWCCALGRRAG